MCLVAGAYEKSSWKNWGGGFWGVASTPPPLECRRVNFKCVFGTTEDDIFGHSLFAAEVRLLESNVNAFLDLSETRNLKEVVAYVLGLNQFLSKVRPKLRPAC